MAERSLSHVILFHNRRLTFFAIGTRENYAFLPPAMPSQQSTDPAARLITILQAAAQTKAHTNYLQFWATAFNLDAKNVPDIYHNIALLQQLVDDVEAGIKKAPHITRPEQYLEPLTQLRTIIAQPNLQSPWHQQRELLLMIINSLRFASERLQEYSPEQDLPPSELEAIHKQVSELIQKLHSSETIPKALKLILFDLLNAVQRSINEYRFRGIRGVREQLFVIASQIQQHSPEFEKAKDAPEVKDFFALLKKIDTLTASALHVKELICVMAPLLPAIPTLVQHLLQ